MDGAFVCFVAPCQIFFNHYFRHQDCHFEVAVLSNSQGELVDAIFKQLQLYFCVVLLLSVSCFSASQTPDGLGCLCSSIYL